MVQRSAVSDWMVLATSPSVVRRALKTAAVVGLILAAINHGDAVLKGDVGAIRFMKMALTFLVPYGVSTTSSVAAIRAQRGRDGTIELET